MYERILDDVVAQGSVTALIVQRTLHFLAGARRSLSLAEIAEEIMIEPGERCLNEEMRVLRHEIILENCSSLVVFERWRQKVTLSHFTVLVRDTFSHVTWLLTVLLSGILAIATSRKARV